MPHRKGGRRTAPPHCSEKNILPRLPPLGPHGLWGAEAALGGQASPRGSRRLWGGAAEQGGGVGWPARDRNQFVSEGSLWPENRAVRPCLVKEVTPEPTRQDSGIPRHCHRRTDCSGHLLSHRSLKQNSGENSLAHLVLPWKPWLWKRSWTLHDHKHRYDFLALWK